MKQIILGGGISGLSTAFYLTKKLPSNIKIYESSNRVGGWIRSVKNKHGTLFELGPRTLRAGGNASVNTLQLIEDLGLSSSVRPISSDSPVAKNRLIYFNKQIIQAPFQLKALIKPNPLTKPFLSAILKDLRTPKATAEDDSIYNFIARRCGEDYAENLISPLVCGIFGGDAKEISVRSIMNDIFEKEQEYGGIFKGWVISKLRNKKKEPENSEIQKKTKGWSVWTLTNGLETLPIHLHKYLVEKNNVEIELGKKCSKVDFKNGEVLLTVDGTVETAQYLYSTLPCKDLAKILGDEHSFLKNELLAVPFVSIAIVNLEYKYKLLGEDAFGLLIPPNQKLPVLGITFDSCIHQEEGKTVLTVMMGGKWFEQYFGANPDEDTLLKVATDHVKMILDINEKPISSMVNVLREAIPQYVVGHSKRVQRIRDYIKEKKLPLTLIGNSFDGVGVNDAILSARNNVAIAIQDLSLNALKSLTFSNQV